MTLQNDVFELIMRVTATSVAGCLMEYALPEGNLKKSASRAIDIVLLVSIAEPIIAAIRIL